MSKNARDIKLSLLIVIFCCGLILIACSNPRETTRTQLLALGTLVDISLYDVNENISAKAINKIESSLGEIHNTWHSWKPSKLTQINQKLVNGKTAMLNVEMSTLIERARELAKASNQLFNPAMGKLVATWGFHDDDPPQGPPPSPESIRAFVKNMPTMNDLIISDNEIRSLNTQLQLDVGGFAKGYAVDMAIAQLRSMGIYNAIVNAGGDLRAIGQHGDRPWRVGIRHPSEKGIIASIETHGDESIFTSGNYERFFDFEGKRYHHIIDPRNGYPASETLSVTVIHGDATTADAAATALFVAGPSEWESIARKMDVHQIMLIDKNLKVHLTTSMAKRIRFEMSPEPVIVLSKLL